MKGKRDMNFQAQVIYKWATLSKILQGFLSDEILLMAISNTVFSSILRSQFFSENGTLFPQKA